MDEIAQEVQRLMEIVVAQGVAGLLPDEVSFLKARRSYLNAEQRGLLVEVLPMDEPFLDEAKNDAIAAQAEVKEEAKSEPDLTPEPTINVEPVTEAEAATVTQTLETVDAAVAGEVGDTAGVSEIPEPPIEEPTQPSPESKPDDLEQRKAELETKAESVPETTQPASETTGEAETPQSDSLITSDDGSKDPDFKA